MKKETFEKLVEELTYDGSTGLVKPDSDQIREVYGIVAKEFVDRIEQIMVGIPYPEDCKTVVEAHLSQELEKLKKELLSDE